jgi:hypothetical protein
VIKLITIPTQKNLWQGKTDNFYYLNIYGAQDLIKLINKLNKAVTQS